MAVPVRLAQLAGLLPPSLLKFLAVGLTGLFVHTATFTLALRLGLDKSPAWFCGLCTSTLVAWSLNRRHTFQATGRSRREEMVRYALVTAVAQGVSFATFHAASGLAPALPPQIFVVLGAVVATGFSYTGQRFFTFAPPRPQAA